MITFNKEIAAGQISVLASIKNHTLSFIEATLAAPPDMAWNIVRLHTSGGCVDVNCLLESAPINDEGDEDEFGIISVNAADEAPLDVQEISADTSVITIDGKITGIRAINSTLVSLENGIPFCERKYTRAIVIEMGNRALYLDRQVWFHEMLSVQIGDIDDNLIRDESVDWEDDPDEPEIHFELITQEIRI